MGRPRQYGPGERAEARIRLPRQLLAQAQEAAELRDVGVNLLFERALRDYLVRLRLGPTSGRVEDTLPVTSAPEAFNVRVRLREGVQR
jgi:hypothetical protein